MHECDTALALNTMILGRVPEFLKMYLLDPTNPTPEFTIWSQSGIQEH